MNDAAWARVVEARTERDDLRPQRVWALRKDGREATIHLKAVPGIGAGIALTVDGEMRKTRLFRSHEQAELVGAIAGHADDVRGEGMSVNAFAGIVQTIVPTRDSPLVFVVFLVGSRPPKF